MPTKKVKKKPGRKPKKKLVKFLIFLFCIRFLISNRNDWSTSPIDNFINNNFNQMIYKNPIYLIPYDLKIGFSTYGGSNYFKNLVKGISNPESNPVILDNQDVNNDFILSSSERSIFFIEKSYWLSAKIKEELYI